MRPPFTGESKALGTHFQGENDERPGVRARIFLRPVPDVRSHY